MQVPRTGARRGGSRPARTQAECFAAALLFGAAVTMAPVWPWVPPTSPSFRVSTTPTAVYGHPPGFRPGLVTAPPPRIAKPVAHGLSRGCRWWEERRADLPKSSVALSSADLKSASAPRHAHPGYGTPALTPPRHIRTQNPALWSLGLRRHPLSNPLWASWLAPSPPSRFLRQRPSRPHRREELLLNSTRAAIVREVQRAPGIHYRELARRLGLSDGSLEYHLHLMERADIVRSVWTSGRTLYFDAEASLAPQGPILQEPEREILDCIRTGEFDSLRAIAFQLGLTYGEVSYHVQKLRAQGLVGARRGNEGLILSVTQEV